MTNIELRRAKTALLRAYQAEVAKFQDQTGLRVSSINVEIVTVTTVDGATESCLAGINVTVDL